MSWSKYSKKIFLSLFIGLLLSFILAETILRLFADRFPILFSDSTLSYRKDEKLGYTLAQSQEGSYHRRCYRIYPIRVNSIGFRDNEWSRESDFKIAVLGDSFMQALQISEGDHTSDTLEKLLNKEVLNSAISGYGTVAELVVYKRVLRPLRPDIVIIFFHLGSDINDNSCELSKKFWSRIERPCCYIKDGKIKFETVFDFVSASDSGGLISRIKNI